MASTSKAPVLVVLQLTGGSVPTGLDCIEPIERLAGHVAHVSPLLRLRGPLRQQRTAAGEEGESKGCIQNDSHNASKVD